jgi:hypothetical protein
MDDDFLHESRIAMRRALERRSTSEDDDSDSHSEGSEDGSAGASAEEAASAAAATEERGSKEHPEEADSWFDKVDDCVFAWSSGELPIPPPDTPARDAPLRPLRAHLAEEALRMMITCVYEALPRDAAGWEEVAFRVVRGIGSVMARRDATVDPASLRVLFPLGIDVEIVAIVRHVLLARESDATVRDTYAAIMESLRRDDAVGEILRRDEKRSHSSFWITLQRLVHIYGLSFAVSAAAIRSGHEAALISPLIVSRVAAAFTSSDNETVIDKLLAGRNPFARPHEGPRFVDEVVKRVPVEDLEDARAAVDVFTGGSGVVMTSLDLRLSSEQVCARAAARASEIAAASGSLRWDKDYGEATILRDWASGAGIVPRPRGCSVDEAVMGLLHPESGAPRVCWNPFPVVSSSSD